MNFEVLVGDCESDATIPQPCGDYEELRPRSYTGQGHDILCTKTNGLSLGSINGSNRTPLMSSDPKTSSLDRNTNHNPNRTPLMSIGSKTSSLDRNTNHNPNRTPLMSIGSKTSSLDRHTNYNPLFLSPSPMKRLPFLLSQLRSKSANTSPSHAVIHEQQLSDGAEVQDSGGSCTPLGHSESSLDFGYRRPSDYDCWAGSNESFSDLDRGMTRVQGTIYFKAGSPSCSSQSQLSDNELSKSSESIDRLDSQACGRSNSICAFHKSCENVYEAIHTGKKKHKSLPSRNTRSKSSGGMIIHKFSKKLSKLNLGGGGRGGEGSGGGSKKKKSRTSSTSALDPDK